MENTIENLNINVKFNDNLGDASKRLGELAESITSVNEAAGKSSAVGRMSKNVKSLDDATSKLKTSEVFKEVGTSTKAASVHVNSFTSSLTASIIKLAVFVRAMKTLGTFIMGGVTDVNNLGLGIRHMNNLFGEGAHEVIEYAREVERLMGIPMADFLSSQGTFGNMLAGFGVGQDNVRKMSQGLVQLSYDLEAVNTIGAKQSDIMSMMQSGLSGYDKSLRKLGYALREVELQEILDRNGLEMKVSQLDRAGKSQLVYMSIMEQSAQMGVFGSLAKQTQSPIVAFNILKNQIRLLAQTLASVLLPVIMGTMKYLQAFAMAITNVIVKLAALFGIKITPLDFGTGNAGGVYGGDGGLADTAKGLGNVGKKAGGATKKIKEMKDQLGGFDKLNVMKQESPSTPSAGGVGGLGAGGGIGGIGGMEGLDLPIPEYGDFLGDMLEDARALSKALEPIVWALGALAAWKIGSWFMSIPLVAKAFEALKLFLGPLIAEFGILGTVGKGIAAVFGFILSPTGLLIGAIIAISVAIYQLWQDNERFRDNVMGVWESIKNIVSAVWENILQPIFEIMGITLRFIIDHALVPMWDSFKEVFEAISNIVMIVWNEVLAPIIVWLIEKFGVILPGVVTLFSAAFALAFKLVSLVFVAAMKVITFALDLVADLFVKFLDWIKGFEVDWRKVWEGAKKVYNTISNFIADGLKWLWDRFKDFIKWITSFEVDWGKIWETIKTVFSTIANSISTKVSWVIDKFLTFINWIRGFEVDWKGVWEGIKLAFSGVWDVISSVVTMGKGIFKGLIDFVAGVFTGDWSRAWSGVKGIFNSVWEGIKGIVSGAWKFILGLFSSGGKIFSGVVGAIANVFRTIVNSIIGGMNKVIAAPFNTVNRMLNSIRGISILGLKPFSGMWGYSPIRVPNLPRIPAYDVGTGHVTHDHIAQIHQGEAIIPKKFNDKEFFGKSNDEEQTRKLLKEANTLLNKILQKDSTVQVSSSNIESAGNDYRRMVIKSKGGA